MSRREIKVYSHGITLLKALALARHHVAISSLIFVTSMVEVVELF
jgi:hypothetical protein